MNTKLQQIKEIGIFQQRGRQRFIYSINKGPRVKLKVSKSDANNAQDGELVEYNRYNWNNAHITERIGAFEHIHSLTDIAIRTYELSDSFSNSAVQEASVASRLKPKSRTDLRHLNFITIDPEDACDHDDAVFAQADDDPNNSNGHIIWCAISDVAHFVRPSTLLCREARQRGNSTYFPDTALPMLPEILSSHACSLHANTDRPCIVVQIIVDANGQKISHQFFRALIRSRASLSYEAAQNILNDASKDDFLNSILVSLNAAYHALAQERHRRQPLNLATQERKLMFSDDGQIKAICIAETLECHKMIESFMILANICAAETLHTKRMGHICRIHEEPKSQKLEQLSSIAKSYHLISSMIKNTTTQKLNQLLSLASKKDCLEMINSAVLRSMTQAVYKAESGGHFGLNLSRYVHFTSPIRRYSDLITHRALIRALKLGEGGITDQEINYLPTLAEHLSKCERRSVAAERETLDRFTAAYLSDKVHNKFSAAITSVMRFGIFVRIDDIGAEGLVPISKLGRGYFEYDAKNQLIKGKSSDLTYKLGQRVTVKLTEVDKTTGQLNFTLNHDRNKPNKRHRRNTGHHNSRLPS